MASQIVETTSAQAVAERQIYEFLSNGSTGNAVGNYASAADQFEFAPSPKQVAEIERIIVYIEDSGNPDSGKYGNNITLTNGVRIAVVDENDVVVKYLDGGAAIKTNAQWGALCYDVKVVSWGSGNDSVIVRWTFAKSGRPLVLDGSQGHKLAVILNDNFSNLVVHTFMIQGYYRQY